MLAVGRHRRSEVLGRRPGGFTLVELTIVMAIIAIVVSLILVVSMDGVRRAEERATQGLIAKLDMAVTDRLDALMSRSVNVNGAHQYLAAIYPPPNVVPAGTLPWGLPSEDRARVIARLDAIRAEMPDSFIVNANPDPNGYPFIFDDQPYPGDPAPNVLPAVLPHAAYVLPLGHVIMGYRPESLAPDGSPMNRGPGANWIDPSKLPGSTVFVNTPADSAGTGIYGASYSARAAFNKLLGCGPKGYDTVDNDGDGLVDEWDECIADLNANQVSELLARLDAHSRNPNTARSEALYALLVEGIGPSDSSFSREDFTERQIADTDGDGLPEFVDPWGQPLQFYRWPIFYPSPTQRGIRPYLASYEAREVSPLDPNSTLVTPAWWSAAFNGGGNGQEPSLAAQIVMLHFVRLIDPGATSTWDRSGATPRRAFAVRPLILSSGRDRQPGTLIGVPRTLPPPPTRTPESELLIPADLFGLPSSVQTENKTLIISTARPIAQDPDAVGFDDLSNQTLQQSGGTVQ